MPASSAAAAEEAVRALLPHTWHAFYGRFGRLRAIQVEAAGPVIGGADVLVSAPTASGKTEALMAPLLERVLATRPTGPGPWVLVVSPTRALVNDLARRLTGPVGRLDIRVGRKHGDLARPPGAELEEVLVTTPESLDSLLARRPRALRCVQAVVLDELHLLRGTARGDQLRSLLVRLERVAARRPQRCGCSATSGAGGALAAEFLGPGAVLVRAGGQRTIDARLEAAATLEEASRVIRGALSGGARKLLVFANQRGQVEALGALLGGSPRLRGRVFVHHGSLARAERERVEARFASDRVAVCVATTTLEIGVDIGDLDGVVLVAPPANVRSLLQRAGRGNRREAVTHVVGLYGSEMERRRFEHLLECAANGRMFDEATPFRPSVAAQQALGLVMQSPRGWVEAQALASRLPPHTVSLDACEAILAHMAEAGVLRSVDGGRYVLDQEGERLCERGRMHSLIRDRRETEVVDAMTGRPLGTARVTQAEREGHTRGAGVSVSLGGKRREVSRVDGDRVFVTTVAGTGDARFIAREAPRYSAALSADLGRSLGLGPGEVWQVPAGDKRWRLHHFLGTTWGLVLDGLLRADGFKGKGAGAGGALATDLTRPLPAIRGVLLGAGEVEAEEARVELIVRGRGRALCAALGAGAFTELVPPELLDQWLVEAVDVPGLVAHLRAVTVVERAGLSEES